MKRDKPLIAAAIGIVSAIIYQIFTQLFVHFGIGKYTLYQLDSFIITINRPTPIIGFVVSSCVGCFIAVLFYYGTNKIGSDYFVIKASIVALMFWVVLEVFFTAIIENKTIPIRPISDYYIHILGSLIFGISMGLLIKQSLIEKTKP